MEAVVSQKLKERETQGQRVFESQMQFDRNAAAADRERMGNDAAMDRTNVGYKREDEIAGEEGTALYFRDPDGNQYELWATDTPPPSAMEGDNKAGLD